MQTDVGLDIKINVNLRQTAAIRVAAKTSEKSDQSMSSADDPLHSSLTTLINNCLKCEDAHQVVRGWCGTDLP